MRIVARLVGSNCQGSSTAMWTGVFNWIRVAHHSNAPSSMLPMYTHRFAF